MKIVRPVVPIFILFFAALSHSLAILPVHVSPVFDLTTKHSPCESCDNATDGGQISGNETGCANPFFDPSPIISVVLPSGGTGTLEYIWIFTTTDPSLPAAIWNPMPGTNAPDFDPMPITQTTWYRRCARRSGCTDYVAETNIIKKEIFCCQIQAAATFSDVSCHGGSNGSIQLTVTNALAPITYQWDHGIGNVEDPTGLAPGTYSVTITDANGCSISGLAVTISEPPVLTLNIQTITEPVCANPLGSLHAIAGGGTGNLNYHWNTNAVTSQISQLGPGTYTVTITDANGCTLSGSSSLQAQQPLLSLGSQSENITCHGAANGSISLEPSGGVSPYHVTWSPSGPDNLTRTGLAPGIYQATVSDANGCLFPSSTFIISEPATLSCEVQILQTISAPGVSDGKLTVIPSGGTPSYTVLWSNGMTIPTISGLPYGVYAVTVTDSNGCSSVCSDTLHNAVLDLINLGDYVWYDTNMNGIQDADETGVNGVLVKLLGPGGDLIFDTPDDVTLATATTAYHNGTSGYYLFSNLAPGSYQVCFSPGDAAYHVSPANQGSNDALDSDADPVSGKTATITLVANQDDDLTVDCGIYKDCDNVTGGGSIGYNEVICGAGTAPDTIISLSDPVGGHGAFHYVWLFSTTPTYSGPGDPNWTMIMNSDHPWYYPLGLGQTTYFIRCSRREGCSEYPGETNIVAKVVQPFPFANIATSPQGTLCAGTSGAFAASYVAQAQYLWDFGQGASPSSASTRVVPAVSWSQPGVKTVSLTVTVNGCSLTVTTSVNVVQCLTTGGNLMMVYPNPVQNTTTLLLSKPTEDPASLLVMDPQGRVLKKIMLPVQLQTRDIDLSDLPAGLYFLQFQHKGDRELHKVFKQE